MARSVLASDTQTAVIATEHTLIDETGSAGKVLDGWLDLGNMVSGDAVEIRVYLKVLGGGTLRRVYYQKYVGSQDDEGALKSPNVYIPAVTATSEYKVTLKQTAGTGRDFDWAIYSD